MGWTVPVGPNYGIHAARRYGYTDSGPEASLPWYRDFMSGKVQDGPVKGLVAPYRNQYLGIPPMAWYESTPLTSALTHHSVP